ncbi:MAG: hypothetical protein AAB267_09465, partial [Candidatus Desantisbacteria bacterium]
NILLLIHEGKGWQTHLEKVLDYILNPPKAIIQRPDDVRDVDRGDPAFDWSDPREQEPQGATGEYTALQNCFRLTRCHFNISKRTVLPPSAKTKDGSNSVEPNTSSPREALRILSGLPSEEEVQCGGQTMTVAEVREILQQDGITSVEIYRDKNGNIYPVTNSKISNGVCKINITMADGGECIDGNKLEDDYKKVSSLIQMLGRGDVEGAISLLKQFKGPTLIQRLLFEVLKEEGQEKIREETIKELWEKVGTYKDIPDLEVQQLSDEEEEKYFRYCIAASEVKRERLPISWNRFTVLLNVEKGIYAPSLIEDVMVNAKTLGIDESSLVLDLGTGTGKDTVFPVAYIFGAKCVGIEY